MSKFHFNIFISQKINRLSVLFQTSKYLLKNEGFFSFSKQMIRFLLGYRQNVIIPPKPEPLITDPLILYHNWIKKNEKESGIIKKLNYQPLFSIITPTFNTDPKMLKAMFESVISQTYQNWQLCIADGNSSNKQTKKILQKYERKDKRIKIKYLSENLGISSNSNEALSLAKGEFIALLDHDDELASNALMENAVLLNNFPEGDMIYSDEDKLDEKGIRRDPFFKPDWSPDLFTSMMYTCHLGVYRKSIIDELGGFRSEFDGAQDYDLVLRLIEKTSKIFHIPKILYHWRISKGSTSMSLGEKSYARKAQIKAVAEHFERLNIKADVSEGLADNLVRVKRHLITTPKVSIIIPTCDKVELLQTCIKSILDKTTYKNYEILIVNNNSKETETFAYFEKIAQLPNIFILEYPFPFNFSAINNFAATKAKGELLLFLNNDTEVINEEWLESMVEHGIRPEVGAVGARLLYSDDTVQHAGVILGIGGVAGHSHKHFRKDHPGYFSRALSVQNLSAVTAACMLVRKETFEMVGGFNEIDLAIAFNDVDLCLKIREQNLFIIFTSYAELYHYESISRGLEDSPEKVERFNNEVNYMIKTWNQKLLNDPYYNPNLTLTTEDFSINPNQSDKSYRIYSVNLEIDKQLSLSLFNCSKFGKKAGKCYK